MRTRAKFYCAAVNPSDEGGPNHSENVTFRAVTNDTEENKTWSKWTPNGLLEMTITNPARFGAFKQGDEYFIDVTPANPVEPTA